jgi:hypothetical protein
MAVYHLKLRMIFVWLSSMVGVVDIRRCETCRMLSRSQQFTRVTSLVLLIKAYKFSVTFDVRT